jgi:hypothetical protein
MKSSDLVGSKLFLINEQEAKDICLQAMKFHFSEAKISEVFPPSIGYKARYTMLLDYLDISIVALPSGDGYVFEMQTEGTAVVTGNSKAKSILREAVALAQQKSR